MKDSLGRDWQTGTIQLDFQIPKKFNLSYIDSDGKEKTPVVIHRVVYGSLERFIGILTEHLAGAFPVWLSPVQAIILPITDKQLDYAKKVEKQLKSENIRVEIDDKSEPLGARIRDSQMQKVPYMLILGGKEEQAGTISVRGRNGTDHGQIPLKKFLEDIKKEIDGKIII